MAQLIDDKLYRVAIGSEYNFVFIQAKTMEELIRFLADNYPDRREIFGARECNKDGSLSTVKLLDNPLFTELFPPAWEKAEKEDLPAGLCKIDGKLWAVAPPFFANIRFPDRESGEYVQDYIPVLIPLDPDTMMPSSTFFLGRNNGDLFCFGSLYMDGIAVSNEDVPAYTPGADLFIGDSDIAVPNRILWHKDGNSLVADRPILRGISDADLNKQGLDWYPECICKHAPRDGLDASIFFAQLKLDPAQANQVPQEKERDT